MNIGYSAGTLRKVLSNKQKILEEFRQAGVNAIEMHTEDFNLTRDFDFCTLHAGPGFRIEDLSKFKDIQGIVVHPSDCDDYAALEAAKSNFLIENMDIRKEKGILLEEFKRIKDTTNLGFVLDVQHAWEHDHAMQYAKKLLDIMGNRLHHVHVSGCLAEGKDAPEELIHVPVHRANNKAEITCFVKQHLSDLPIILEGDYESTEDMREEIAYWKAILTTR